LNDRQKSDTLIYRRWFSKRKIQQHYRKPSE
jgi:hypothetical protein